MRFFNFVLAYMVQKYQNENAPIFYYGISTKTNEKDLKIPILQPPDWKNPYWMSLYIREIMMGEGNEQPPLCWLPLWVVELGLVAENSLEQANHSFS